MIALCKEMDAFSSNLNTIKPKVSAGGIGFILEVNR